MTALAIVCLFQLLLIGWGLVRLDRIGAEQAASQRLLDRTHIEISLMREDLEREAQYHADDFATKMKAMQRFMALWNAGLREEAREVLSDVGFVEASLQ